MANKPKIKKKERMVKKEGEKRKTTTTLSEKKEEASNVSEHRDKGWIHVIRSSDNTAGRQTLTNYPTQRKNERSR